MSLISREDSEQGHNFFGIDLFGELSDPLLPTRPLIYTRPDDQIELVKSNALFGIFIVH